MPKKIPVELHRGNLPPHQLCSPLLTLRQALEAQSKELLQVQKKLEASKEQEKQVPPSLGLLWFTGTVEK